MKSAALVLLGVMIGAVGFSLAFYFFPKATVAMHKQSFSTNIIKATVDNPDFRQVLFTGDKSQLVVMSIPPGSEVGLKHTSILSRRYFFSRG